MPISRREFEKGRTDLATFILEFLKLNDEMAYSQKELLVEVLASGRQCNQDDIAAAIKDLDTQHRIESRTIGVVIYYSYLRTMGFRSSKVG